MKKPSNPFKRASWKLQTPSFKPTVDEILRFKEDVADIACPACEQKKLEVPSYVQGPTDWEAAIECQNCDFAGVVNKLGFNFTKVNSKGKAVSRVKNPPPPETPEVPPSPSDTVETEEKAPAAEEVEAT
jgi:hypothetical protein